MSSSPKQIGSYDLVEVLGRGSMGVVYRALSLESGEWAALKTVEVPSAGLLQSVRREIHALARLRHPGIVRVLGEGLHEGVPWYAMELLEGRTLRELCARGRLEPHAALRLVRRLCAPLAYLHGEGIVHGDLKPENILLCSSMGVGGRGPGGGEPQENKTPGRGDAETRGPFPTPDTRHPTPYPVLVDFGLVAHFAAAQSSRETLELAGAVSGTVAYMAPEQLLGELVDARADLYSLGCLLYELLTGRRPFDGGTPVQTARAHLHQAPVRPSELCPGLSAELEELVLQLLAKRPQDRIGHADLLAAALAGLGAGEAPWTHEPAARAYLYRPGLAGRAGPLRQLEGLLAALRSGAGGLVLLGGESGVGKTRLALELARQAKRQGLEVLGGQSGSVPAAGPGRVEEALQPLRPVLQFLADRCRSGGPDETERLLGPHAASLALYEPALLDLPGQRPVDPPAELTADAALLRLYTALLETLAALLGARRQPAEPGARQGRPLLLLLDDLHWADDLTLGFLEFLIRTGGLESLPLLIVATYRTEEAGGRLQGWLQSASVRHLVLGRLDEEAVGSMVRDMLGLAQPPEAFVHHLSQHSEGNPLFVAELLRAAVGQELLCRDALGRWQLADRQPLRGAYEALPLPRLLRDLVSQRLEGLSAGARSVVEAACVLSRAFEAELLAQVARCGGAELLEAVKELLSRQVLEECGPGRLQFVHDKIREVAYERCPGERRRELHRAAAEGIETWPAEQRSEHLAELGSHWQRAGEAARARPCYLAAAERAVLRSALAEAERLYQAYLELGSGPTPETVSARLELADRVLEVQGRRGEAVAEFERAIAEARSIGDVLGQGRGLEKLASTYRVLGRLGEAQELCEQALALLRETADPMGEAAALGTLGTIRWFLGDRPAAHELLEQALAIFRQLGDRRREAKALSNLGTLRYYQGLVEEASRYYEQALAVRAASGDRLGEGVSLGKLGLVRMDQGRFQEAGELFEQALRIHRETGNRDGEAASLSNLGNLHWSQGRLEPARSCIEQALVLVRQAGVRYQEGVALHNLATLDHLQGRLEQAGILCEQALVAQREAGDRLTECETLQLMAAVRRRSGDLERAEALASEAASVARKLGNEAQEAIGLCEQGHLALARGESGRERLEQALRLVPDPAAPGSKAGAAVLKLSRAVQRFEAGQQLLWGECPADVPAALRHRFLAGQAPAAGQA